MGCGISCAKGRLTRDDILPEDGREEWAKVCLSQNKVHLLLESLLRERLLSLVPTRYRSFFHLLEVLRALVGPPREPPPAILEPARKPLV